MNTLHKEFNVTPADSMTVNNSTTNCLYNAMLKVPSQLFYIKKED